MPESIAVIVCDLCGLVTPEKFHDRATQFSSTGTEQDLVLRSGGWYLSAEMDLCPKCADIEGAV